MMTNRNTRLLSFDSCKICLQVFLDFTLQKQNKTTVMNNHQLRKIFISVLLSVCSVIFAFGQNEKSLVDRILKNPEYQNQWSEIQQMRKENVSDKTILDYLGEKTNEKVKRLKKLNPVTSFEPKNTFLKGNLPITNSSCSGLGVDNGWGAWQARTGSIAAGVITWDAAGWVAPASPRFNLTSGSGIDACTPGPNAASPSLPVVCPGFGNASIQIGQLQTNGALGNCGTTVQVLPPPVPPQLMPGGCVEQLTYPLTVTASDTNFVYS